MDAAEQKSEFDKIVARARRAGLLKFEHEGIAVIELPPAPVPTVACSSAVPDAASSSAG